jgi:hypothetical protein
VLDVPRVRWIVVLALIALAVVPAGVWAGEPRMVVDGWRTVEGRGRFVPIPGFPGEKIDRRVLPDVLWMVRRFGVHVNDGYSLSGVHEATGEHPRGLAVDLVPGPDGSWASLSRLARWAEPQEDAPRAPFKWVGWNGDRSHGDPGHCKVRKGCWPHLHISWQHAPGPRARPAAWVNVLRFRPAG